MFWLGTKQKKLTKRRCTFLCQHWEFLSSNCAIEWESGVVGIFFKSNIDGETFTTIWVIFPSVLWRLLVPLCTVLSGASWQVGVENYFILDSYQYLIDIFWCKVLWGRCIYPSTLTDIGSDFGSNLNKNR